MKRRLNPKNQKLSGAAGRKKAKLQEEEAKKSSKLMKAFLRKGGDAAGPSSAPKQQAPSDTEQETEKVEKLEEEKESKAEEHEGPKDQNVPKADVEVSKEHESHDIPVDSDIQNETEIKNPLPEIIANRDIGYLRFDENSGKAIISDGMRSEIVKRGSTFFQNANGPFEKTNNRSMNSKWFKRRLGKGQGEEVTRS